MYEPLNVRRSEISHLGVVELLKESAADKPNLAVADTKVADHEAGRTGQAELVNAQICRGRGIRRLYAADADAIGLSLLRSKARRTAIDFGVSTGAARIVGQVELDGRRRNHISVCVVRVGRRNAVDRRIAALGSDHRRAGAHVEIALFKEDVRVGRAARKAAGLGRCDHERRARNTGKKNLDCPNHGIPPTYVFCPF